MKLDFGTHIDGRTASFLFRLYNFRLKLTFIYLFAGHIVDCAFTVALDPLLAASREATYTGIKVLIVLSLFVVFLSL